MRKVLTKRTKEPLAHAGAVPPKQIDDKGLLDREASNLSSPDQIIERLKSVLAQADSLSLPTGELGRAFLDCLELTDKIREKAREKAREVLLKEPGAIPGWSASQCGPVRELDKDTVQIFEALQKADDEITLTEFLSICSVSVGAVTKLLKRFNPGLSDTQLDNTVNRILERLIHRREGSVRLTRVKETPSAPLPATMEVVVR